MRIESDDPKDLEVAELREWHGSLAEKHAHLEKELNELTRHLELGNRALPALERKIAVTTARIGHERQRIFEVNHQKSRWDAKAGRLAREVASQEERLAGLKQSHAIINAESETIGAELKVLDAATAPLAVEKAALDERVATLAAQKNRLLGTLEVDLTGSAVEREKRMGQIDATGKQLTHIIMARDNIRREVAAQSTANAELESRITRFSNEKHKFNRIKALRSRHDRILDDLAKASERRDALSRSLEAEQGHLAEKAKALATLAGDNTRLQNQIEVLEPQLADYESQRDRVDACREEYHRSGKEVAANEKQLLSLLINCSSMADRLRTERAKADKMLQTLKTTIRQGNPRTRTRRKK